MELSDLCPNEPSQPITHDTLKILLGKNLRTEIKYYELTFNFIIHWILDTLDGEILKIQDHAISLFKKRAKTPLQPTGVQQAVKALIAFLGNIEPLDITLTLNNFVSSCNEISNVIQVSKYLIKIYNFFNIFFI